MSTTDSLPTQETAQDKRQANQFNTGWTAERLDTLKRLFTAGASQQEIANELGVTRNAIAGKIDRLGLRDLSQRKPRPSRAGKPRPPSSERMTPFRAPKPIDPAPLPDETPGDGVGLSLVELTNATCRWPKGVVGEEGFCFCGRLGADFVASKPYCREHTRAARRV